MSNMLAPAAIALAFLCLPGNALAGETWPPPAPGDAGTATVDGPAWLAGIAGEKLVSVDGSTIVLAPSEGGLALALTSPDGAAQKSTFAFMSDKLGTISDDTDAGHVTGFFRATDTGLEAQFADGRTESLVANMAGGISLTIRASASESTCTSWYPSDHVFGGAERRAALAAYAERLGLAQHSKKTAHSVSVCVPAIHAAKARLPSPGSAQPLVVVTHPASPQTHQGTDIMTSGAGEAALIPVAVRNSQIHLVDGAVAAPLAALAQSPAPSSPPPQTVAAKIAPPQPPPASATPPVSAPPPPVQTAIAAPATTGNGASDCLSVDTDGANLGFRNRCAYGVQFAYCLQRASDPSAACDAGSRSGAVAANGFATVLLDTNIKSADAEHDFRWVGCSGNAGDVVAHLDRADPPAGRCVRANAL